jgi:hypothetical protein
MEYGEIYQIIKELWFKSLPDFDHLSKLNLYTTFIRKSHYYDKQISGYTYSFFIFCG